MIKVYFESGGHAQHIATFYGEGVYMLALPALEDWAKSINGIITESVVEETA